MTDHTDRSPDRHEGSPGSPPDLAVLMSHPSLASLRKQGWRLDRLPTTSTAWAFAGTLLISMIAFGPTNAFLVVVIGAMAVAVTGYSLAVGDHRSARGILLLARVCLLVWVLTGGATLLWSPPDSSPPIDTATVSAPVTDALQR